METNTAQPAITSTEVHELLEQEARNLRRGRRVYRLVLSGYGIAAAVFVLLQVISNRPQTGYPQDMARRFAIPHKSSHPDNRSIQFGKRNLGLPEPEDAPLVHPFLTVDPPGRESWTLRLDRFPWAYALIILSLGWLVFAVLRRALRVQKRAAGTLAVLDDPHAVGPLAECLTIDDRHIRRLTEEALIRLLPRLRASDAETLNDEQHRHLNRALHNRNGALALAIVGAYEQVGDSCDLPYVEALAEGHGRARKNGTLREAAVQCLPFLQLRAQRQLASQTYLRAATLSETEATLLRPATSSSCEVNSLLRTAE